MVNNSRVKPFPVTVVNVNQVMLLDWNTFLDDHYAKKCPFRIQGMNEVSATSSSETSIPSIHIQWSSNQ